jgi:hypothetical protein
MEKERNRQRVAELKRTRFIILFPLIVEPDLVLCFGRALHKATAACRDLSRHRLKSSRRRHTPLCSPLTTRYPSLERGRVVLDIGFKSPLCVLAVELGRGDVRGVCSALFEIPRKSRF